MMTSTRELVSQTPKTGPWIIGYVLTFAALMAANALGFTLEPQMAPLVWIPLVGCTGMIIYTSWRRHRMLGTLSNAVKTFWRRMVTSAGFMFASFCVLAYAQMVGQWGQQAEQILLAMASVGFAGMIWCVHQYVADESDEYLREQSVRQLLIASFVTLIVALGMSTLAPFFGGGSPALGLVVLLWFGGLGIGRLVNEMRP